MNIQKTTFFLFCIGLIFTQSACFMPVGNHFETAKTLKKNNIAVSGNASYYSSVVKGGISSLNFGAQLGYGLTDKLDLKLRYERLNYGGLFGSGNLLPQLFPDGGSSFAMNYLSLIGKYSLIEDRLAVTLPVNFYFQEGGFVSISPTIIGTHTFNDHVDLSGSGTIHVFMSGDNFSPGVGINLGLGLSTNLDKWAVRPELGLQYYGFGAVSAGLGFQYRISN